MTAFPLLTLLLLVPGLGILLSWLWPRAGAARVIALVATLVDLLLGLVAVGSFDAAQAGFQFVETASWIPSLGVFYRVGVDGLSLLFLPATALLFAGVILSSWNSVHTLSRFYYSLILLLEMATLGVFCALDTILFFLFWELTLIPLYFLVSLWGIGANRRHAATKYVLVMMTGGVGLLFALLLVAFGAGAETEELIFELPALLQLGVPTDMQYLVFLLFLIGFGVKMPLFPLHTWLPLISMEGPAAIAALLTGLKLGAYGLIRFAVPLAPVAAQELHWLLAALGTIAILFGATAALAQTNLRRMLGYASLSHIGLVLLGIASFNLQGVQGAVMQLLNFVVAGGGLFLMVSQLHHRTGTTDLASLSGAARSMPLLASFFLLFGLSSMGLPGTLGFPGELLIFISSFERHAGAGLAALAGTVIGAAAFLNLYRRTCFGPCDKPAVALAQDLVARERWLAIVLALVAIGFGIWPASLLEIIRPAAEAWIAQLG